MKAGRWTTIAVNKGLRPLHINVEVWAPRTARWRRISILPGFGRFRQFLSIALPLGFVQVKIRENRTCTVTFGRSTERAYAERQAEEIDA